MTSEAKRLRKEKIKRYKKMKRHELIELLLDREALIAQLQFARSGDARALVSQVPTKVAESE